MRGTFLRSFRARIAEMNPILGAKAPSYCPDAPSALVKDPLPEIVNILASKR